MGCNCHGKSGTAVTRTSPFDQCSTCAKKHVVKAWSLFHEFLYADDNRDSISGQLWLVADHLMYDHRNAEITTEWEGVLTAAREAFNTDHPDAIKRRGILRTSTTRINENKNTPNPGYA